MKAQWMSEEEWLRKWKTGVSPLQGPYLGFYSSVADGFFKEPWGYWVPLDDHIVHRGDGVFEAIRIIERAYFDLDGHLARLARSADQVSMNLPFPISEIRARCLDLARLCDVSEGVLRLYVSRGPGGFTPNPYEPKRSQLYLAMTPWKNPATAWYESGVRAGISHVPGKRPFEATIKSCNYLQNVLQKKDALDRGLDFTVCLDDHGQVLEGATESFCVLSGKDELLIPSTEITLSGTTMRVVADLARDLAKEGLVKNVAEVRLKAADVAAAKEMAFVGTTIAVCPVTTWESQPVGDGRVGPAARELGRRLEAVMRGQSRLRTAF